MKRLLFILVGFISMLGARAEQFIMGDLKYTVIANNEVSVSAKNESISGKVTIPQFIYAQDTKYSVTTIERQGFYNCTSLTSVNIPNSVTSIWHYAFYNCTSLTSINIPNSVTSIGEGAFNHCTSLTSINVETDNNYYCSLEGALFNKNATTLIQYPIGKSTQSYKIPNSVTFIGESAFYYCTSLTSIDIPNSVTSIGDEAFSHCSDLTSIEIPNSVTSIGKNAFSQCTNLTSVNIPNSVTSIGDWAFNYCTSLTSINVETDNNYYCSIDGVLFNKEATTLIQYPIGKSEQSYNIPNSVTTIGKSAFSYCTNLTSINIPNSVTSIGESAFYYCTSLTSIDIPNSVTSIGEWAFNHCTSLTSINIPNSVTAIWHYAFYNCTSLISIDIPNSVTSIGDWAFDNCRSLTSINIPNSVTSIGEKVFNNCTSLTSIDISNSVTTIGENAFGNCRSLTSIDIPNSVTSIGYCAFYNCTSLTSINVETDNNYYCSIDGVLFNKNATTLIQYPIGKSEQSYNIPNSVTAIGDWAFGNCTSLTSINISNSVTSIGNRAFYYCTSLTSIEISNAVTSIGYHAFYNCTSLNRVYCQPTTPPTGAPGFAADVYANATLYVPSESNDLYASTEPWSKFQNIVGYDFSGVEEVLNPEMVNISVENGRLTVTGLPDGERISIYSMAGRVIYSGSAYNLPILPRGFYLIKAGTTISKVAL